MDDITELRLKKFSANWMSWIVDPIAEQTGISFDRTPAKEITAPKEMIRVCAFHIDFDERPTIYQDVSSLSDASFICENIHSCRADWNVDYAAAFDADGHLVINGRPY